MTSDKGKLNMRKPCRRGHQKQPKPHEKPHSADHRSPPGRLKHVARCGTSDDLVRTTAAFRPRFPSEALPPLQSRNQSSWAGLPLPSSLSRLCLRPAELGAGRFYQALMNGIPVGGSRGRLAVYLPGQCVSGHEVQPFILLLEGVRNSQMFSHVPLHGGHGTDDGEDAASPVPARGTVGIRQRPLSHL